MWRSYSPTVLVTVDDGGAECSADDATSVLPVLLGRLLVQRRPPKLNLHAIPFGRQFLQHAKRRCLHTHLNQRIEPGCLRYNQNAKDGWKEADAIARLLCADRQTGWWSISRKCSNREDISLSFLHDYLTCIIHLFRRFL